MLKVCEIILFVNSTHAFQTGLALQYCLLAKRREITAEDVDVALHRHRSSFLILTSWLVLTLQTGDSRIRGLSQQEHIRQSAR